MPKCNKVTMSKDAWKKMGKKMERDISSADRDKARKKALKAALGED